MWGGSLLSAMWRARMSACHVTARIIQVLLSGAGENCPPSHTHTHPLLQIHNLGNGKRRKLLIKGVPALWLLQAVCRHLEPAVSSPLKEKERGNILINGGTALCDNSPTPPQQWKRWGGGRENNTQRHIWRYIYTFSPQDEPTFDVS